MAPAIITAEASMPNRSITAVEPPNRYWQISAFILVQMSVAMASTMNTRLSTTIK